MRVRPLNIHAQLRSRLQLLGTIDSRVLDQYLLQKTGRLLDNDLSGLATRATGSNKTDLLTSGGVAGEGRGLTNVLVVTTTVGVVHGVHSNTTSTGPRVALGAHGVELATGLEEGLVDTATTSGDTDGSTGGGGDGLLRARGETDTGLAVLVVADDGGVVAGGTGERSTVTDLLLNVEDDGTLGALADGEDVADGKGSLLTGVDERAGRDTLSSDEGLLAELVAVGVTEDDGGEGSTTAGLAKLLFSRSGLKGLSYSVGRRRRPRHGHGETRDKSGSGRAAQRLLRRTS